MGALPQLMAAKLQLSGNPASEAAQRQAKNALTKMSPGMNPWTQ